MNRLTLLFRNLRYFRGVNLAVIAGMAVATAVLTGAMMVGDSVRGSLADLARQRLGPVDYALISPRFFNQSLAERIGQGHDAAEGAEIVPAIIVRGGAANDQSNAADGSPYRTADVQIAALGQTKATSFDGAKFPIPSGAVVLNGPLGDAIDAKVGQSVLLYVPTQSDLPRDAALARRGKGDIEADLRANVSDISKQPSFASLFNPNPSQRVPRNAWTNLADLQDMIEQPARINSLLVHGNPSNNDEAVVAALNQRLSKNITLDDYGLTIRPAGDNESSVFARETYIAPPVIDAARRAAKKLGIEMRPVSVNLLTQVSDDANKKTIHYAVAAGMNPLDAGPLGVRDPIGGGWLIPSPGTPGEGQGGGLSSARDKSFTPSPALPRSAGGGRQKASPILPITRPLADNEIAINQWTADQLGAKVGDTLTIDFYARQSEGDLVDASKVIAPPKLSFVVKYILPMEGLGADKELPPDYKGLTDADSVADWNPPEGLRIDKSLVTKADEDYWHTWRAAPKVFLSFDAAGKLWGGTYGEVTGLRVPTKAADAFAKTLNSELSPQSLGLVFRPIKAQQLAAANGGTDFAGFFLMFSFFLIVAAALLVAMLFRLNVEQRARQLGLLGAIGFAPARLRRLALSEGMILAVVGGIIGLAGALGYTWLIMWGLRTWWIGAIGTTAMRLHVLPLTLCYGLVGSVFVAFLAILWAVWRVGREQPARLMAGAWGIQTFRRGEGRIVRWIGVICILIGVATVVAAIAKKISPEEGFGGGALLLCGALFWIGGVLRPRRHAGASFVGTGSLARLGIRNAARHTARGVLAVGLIGFAAFTLITVAAMQQNGTPDPDKHNSETGGYRLIINADIPLLGDLNTVEGRRILGFREPDAPIFNGVHFTPLRMWHGQDISCLNLTRPNSPTILGVPKELIDRNAFIQDSAISITGNLWTLLDSDQGSDIPVIADADTQEYVLQIPLGGTLEIQDQLGTQRTLKLVATVAHSIFQGQLLMSDGNFRKLFPAQSGFGMVLADMPGAPAQKTADLQKLLSGELGEYSVSVDTTTDRLKVYQNVQNTYLSTFQTLGALGLALGTLGLAVVLIRTVIERKAELALLASLGFTTSARVWLILAENSFLLILGLLVGTVSAITGIIPAVLGGARSIDVPALAATLLAVLVVGFISAAIAVGISGVHVVPADLRSQ